jgi:tetratricopeptide (TPR) repeat protein
MRNALRSRIHYRVLARLGLSILVTAVWSSAFRLSGAEDTVKGGHQTVRAYRGEITLPTYPWAAVKHPYFRGTDKVNIYPYPMLDFLSREKTNRTYRTVVLENGYLRITFLPELGGKVFGVIDKTTGQPMFYVNHVVKPGLIGQCGAWTSGGIEWNTGPQGHTVSAMQPIPVEILPPEKDGSRSVAVGETERIYGTRWTVVVTLRPGRSFIEERIRIYNPTETVRPYYFWNCTAVPNPPGFRFIYPMTLGSDHAGEKFFQWPIDKGRDLTRGSNYQDAASIFAWHCDQDFFGSYDDGADRGVVACANHHQVPGKKAWTWGHGGYGRMYQVDLTDDDGPYNEVQTGPLLTQALVGRLDPCEAVEWKEWWYPIHGLGGFTFANEDVVVNAERGVRNAERGMPLANAGVAANAEPGDGRLCLRMLGTGAFGKVRCTASGGKGREVSANCTLSPQKPVEVVLDVGSLGSKLDVRLEAAGRELASFSVPAYYPERTRPAQKSQPKTASELAQEGWQDYLFARFLDAEGQFRKALEQDATSVEAHTGLAFLSLDRDPQRASEEAEAALAVDADHGLARFALAAAEYRRGCHGWAEAEALLENAWKAAHDPATAVPARALAARVLIRQRNYDAAIEALGAPGPWQSDPVCRSRLAFALLQRGQKQRAVELARGSLAVDPLDAAARGILWLAKSEIAGLKLGELVDGEPNALLGLVVEYSGLGHREAALRLCQEHLFSVVKKGAWDPMVCAWADWLAVEQEPSRAEWTGKLKYLPFAATSPAVTRWPYRWESEQPLAFLCAAAEVRKAHPWLELYRGDLLFHLGRYAEGRKAWQAAAELGAEPAIACRALGMAARTLDNDLKGARAWLEKANRAEPKDAIVARDLANVLFALADKAETESNKHQLGIEARDCLQAAFANGKGRSDFVSLLARTQNRLGDYAATARMLDLVRVKIWEGSHEIHDLFENAHLALGKEHLKAGHPAEALAEFNRALEYPQNLATGRLEGTREAHVNYLRGNALSALGRKQEALAAWELAADEPESSDPQKEAARKKAKEALAVAMQGETTDEHR